MIKFVYANTLKNMEQLASEMFKDRANQFFHRLGWDVTLTPKGEERDEYDSLNPLYVIVCDSFGKHQGSMRLLPTTCRTMVNEHFKHLANGVEIKSPFIWECTRFCVSARAEKRTSALLMAAGAKVMLEFGLDHFVGVFDRSMEPVYRRIGASPTVVGSAGTGQQAIALGLWEFSEPQYSKLLRRCGMTSTEMELFLANSEIGSASERADLWLDRIVA